MKCDSCGGNFNANTKPGALVLSSPKEDGTVDKYHICQMCEPEIVDRLQQEQRKLNEPATTTE